MVIIPIPQYLLGNRNYSKIGLNCYLFDFNTRVLVV